MNLTASGISSGRGAEMCRPRMGGVGDAAYSKPAVKIIQSGRGIRRYLCATAGDAVGAATVYVNHPIIISSQVWSPHFTSFAGSGLYLLFAELSKCATQSIRVPLGRSSGC